jgi:hypothetical protein
VKQSIRIVAALPESGAYRILRRRRKDPNCLHRPGPGFAAYPPECANQLEKDRLGVGGQERKEGGRALSCHGHHIPITTRDLIGPPGRIAPFLEAGRLG